MNPPLKSKIVSVDFAKDLGIYIKHFLAIEPSCDCPTPFPLKVKEPLLKPRQRRASPLDLISTSVTNSDDAATKSSDDCELLDMIVKRGALLICPLTASNVFLMFLSVAIPRETSLVSRQMVDLGPSPFGTYRLYR
jgi:hypothetical protein